ncbi:MAG TPA: flagellar export protein FliJ [Caulobacteraceae bacterium]|nr:flagellar export protein FliJ [Caulobacteraceae bacterium]
MKWAASLIRISTHEVEVLQKRLAEVVDRRVAFEMRLASLNAEEEAEQRHADEHAEARIYLAGFRQGVAIRREKLQRELAAAMLEEEGARDALSEAFEALKKFEKVAENYRLAEQAEKAKKETAALDELGLRRTGS